MEMDYETDYSEKTSEYAPWNMSYIDRAQYKSMRIEQNVLDFIINLIYKFGQCYSESKKQMQFTIFNELN